MIPIDYFSYVLCLRYLTVSKYSAVFWPIENSKKLILNVIWANIEQQLASTAQPNKQYRTANSIGVILNRKMHRQQ